MTRNYVDKEKAAEATLDFARRINGIESPIKKKPNFTKVTSFGTKYGHKAEQLVESTEGSVVFGRSVELSQMPESNIKQRGYTKDIDLFVPNQKQFVQKATKKLGRDFKAKVRNSGNYLIERKDGRDAFDLHNKPKYYMKPTKQDEYVKPEPTSTKDMLKSGGITSEKLYVQAKRKAVSTLGNYNKKSNSSYDTQSIDYGPPSNRIKDPYDMIRYGSYFVNVQTKKMRKLPPQKRKSIRNNIQKIKSDICVVKRYFSQPKVYNKYDEGKEYGKKFKAFKCPIHVNEKYRVDISPRHPKRSSVRKHARRKTNIFGWMT